MCTIKERITSIINSLDEIIESSNEVEPIYQKIEKITMKTKIGNKAL